MPRPTKDTAIRRLQHQLDKIPELHPVRHGSPEFIEWESDTKVAIAYTFSESSPRAKEFAEIRYVPNVYSVRLTDRQRQFQRAFIRGLESAGALLRSMIREVREYWPDDTKDTNIAEAPNRAQQVNTNRVFIIHGRDHGSRDTVARFLVDLELDPVILEEQPDRGLTVIEKFEENAEGEFVVALLTPDDVGGPNENKLRPRARQNVILELGYFIAKFGRERVRALVKGDVEIPSDFSGVLYIPLDEHGGWKLKLAQEMKSAGLNINLNLLNE